MSTKLINHAIAIGDIDIYFNDKYVQVTVDGETALFLPRSADNGLLELGTTLTQLVTKGEIK